MPMDNVEEMEDFTTTRAQRVPSPGDRCYGYLRQVILPTFVQLEKNLHIKVHVSGQFPVTRYFLHCA